MSGRARASQLQDRRAALAKAEPNKNGGNDYVITYLRKKNKKVIVQM